MIIELAFKTPDVTHYALQGLSEEERELAEEAIKKWVEYDEYATIRIDTLAGTAEVKRVSE